MAIESPLSDKALIALTKIARTSTEDAARFDPDVLDELRGRGFVRDLPEEEVAITTRGLRYFEEAPSVPGEIASSPTVAPYQRRPLNGVASAPTAAIASVPATPSVRAPSITQQFSDMLSDRALTQLQQIAAAPEGVEPDVLNIHHLTLAKLLRLQLVEQSGAGLLKATQGGRDRLKAAPQMPPPPESSRKQAHQPSVFAEREAVAPAFAQQKVIVERSVASLPSVTQGDCAPDCVACPHKRAHDADAERLITWE